MNYQALFKMSPWQHFSIFRWIICRYLIIRLKQQNRIHNMSCFPVLCYTECTKKTGNFGVLMGIVFSLQIYHWFSVDTFFFLCIMAQCSCQIRLKKFSQTSRIQNLYSKTAQSWFWCFTSLPWKHSWQRASLIKKLL